MYAENRKRDNIIVLIFCLLTVAAAGFVLARRFQFLLISNDDVMLRSIASGNYTGKPDAHLIYIMYPLGLLLEMFYKMFPSVNWYDCFMTGIHFICVFLITYRVGTGFKKISNRIVASLCVFSLVMIVDMRYLVHHQYTALAGICAAVAIFWAATFDYGKKEKATKVVIIVMLLLSLWLRKQMFVLALPLLCLAILKVTFLKNDTMSERHDKLRSMLPGIIVLVTLIAASFIAEALAYSSPEWKAFKAFNQARTDVYDYDNLPDYYENQDFYASVGIDEAEYTVLREYDIAVADNTGTDELNMLAKKAKSLKKEWASYYSVPRKVINETVAAMNTVNASIFGLMVTVLSLALLLVFAISDEKFAGMLVLCIYLYKWLFVGYFTYVNRMPDRIVHGFLFMELCFLVSMLISALKFDSARKTYSFFWQLVTALLLLGLILSQGLYALRTLMDESAVKTVAADSWDEINAYFKSNPDNVYIVNTSIGAASPAKMFSKNSSEAFNAIKPGNWTLTSPLEKKHEERLIDCSVSEAFLKSDNVYYVLSEEKSPEWLAERFGEVKETDRFTLGSGETFVIYK